MSSEKDYKSIIESINLDPELTKPKPPDEIALKEDAHYLSVKTKEINQIISLREAYAAKIFTFLKWWCIVLLILILLQAYSYYTKFGLDDKVFAVLVGSATVSVIGLIGFMIKDYLIYQKNSYFDDIKFLNSPIEHILSLYAFWFTFCIR